MRGGSLALIAASIFLTFGEACVSLVVQVGLHCRIQDVSILVYCSRTRLVWLHHKAGGAPVYLYTPLVYLQVHLICCVSGTIDIGIMLH